MAFLEAEHLVKRYRRRGTFVTGILVAADGFCIPTRWEEVLAAFEGLKAEVLESMTVKTVPSPFHGGEQARGYAFSRRRYRRNGRAAALEESWLDSSVRGSGVHPLRLLERSRSAKIERAELTLRFGIADREHAVALGAALNAPIAILHLSVLGRGSRLHYESVCFYRGDAARVAESIRFPERA